MSFIIEEGVHPWPEPDPNPPPLSPPTHPPTESSKDIGDYGEERVFEYLKKRYKDYRTLEDSTDIYKVEKNGEIIEIVWWSKIGKGVGCDLIVKKSEEEIEYIEVKTKTSEKLEEFEITESQWNLAQEKLIKYFIYRVIRLGDGKYKILEPIKNPYQKWKNGELEANPIRIKL